jgi:hypothetical protein
MWPYDRKDSFMLAKFRHHMANPAFMLLVLQTVVIAAAAAMTLLLPIQ